MHTLPDEGKRTVQKIAEQTKVNPSTVQRAEKSFDNEHDVINWIIDNQLSRRNITDDQRAYLLGKRYKEEKKTIGENQYTTPKTQSEEDESGVVTVTTPKKTELKIAEQSKVSPKTVRNAEKFADAVDKVPGLRLTDPLLCFQSVY